MYNLVQRLTPWGKYVEMSRSETMYGQTDRHIERLADNPFYTTLMQNHAVKKSCIVPERPN